MPFVPLQEDTPTSGFVPLEEADKTPDTSVAPQGELATAGKEAVMAVPAGAAGGLAATMAGGAIAGSRVPGPPIVKGAAAIGGALVAGFGGSALAQKLIDELTHQPGVQELLSQFGLDDKQRAANIKANPKSAFAGQLASQTLAGGMRPGIPSLKQAALGAGLNTAIEGGSQLAEGQFDSAKLGMAAAAGAMTKPTKLSEALSRGVEGKVRGEEPVPPKEPPKSPSDEEVTGFTKLLESETLKETAFRDPKTGEIKPTGPKHPIDLKNSRPDLEQGFITEDGKFHNRKEALDIAKRTGQIDPEQKLDFPDEGLHSGDLRKAKNPQFEVPKELEVPDSQKRLTLEQGKTVLKEAKTVGEAVDTLLEKGHGTTGQKIILGLLKNSGFAMKAKFGFSDKQLTDPRNPNVLWAGIYNPVEHSVTLSGEAPYSDSPHRVIRDVIHEATHAAAHSLVADPSNVHGQKLIKLYNYVANNLPIDQAHHYGLQNEHEFLSEAFSNSNFQILLKNTKLPGDWDKAGVKQTAWNTFKDLIKNGIASFQGKPLDKAAHTAFDEAIDIGSHLIETPESHVADTRKNVHGMLGIEVEPEIKAATKEIDPRSISNEEEFNRHASTIYRTQGKDAAVQFYKDWKEHQANNAIPIPKDIKELGDTLYKVDTWSSADSSAFRARYEENTYGRKLTTLERLKPTKEMKAQKKAMDDLREKWFRAREKEPGVTLTPEEQARMDKVLGDGDKEIVALIQKARKLTGDPRTLRELETGQSRYRIFSKKDRTIRDFLDTNNPMGDKLAEEASSTRERSVFQTEDGRVIQIEHDPRTDTDFVKEWKDGKPSVWKDKSGKMTGPGYIGRGERGQRLTAGDTVKIDGKDIRIVDGQVHNIERHTPFRYMKDAEGTQAMKLMELRKMTRDLELMDGLKKSGFMNTGKGPETPMHEIPRGYRVPSNIDKIPQLRGWMFEPKTAAIIEDFAKVWDNSLYMKFTSQLIKNMMLNPFPHMMNEAAHLWNLRGLSGWVTPKGMVSFARTGKQAFMDVSTQSDFYRQIMKEGGATLGAEPRNSEHWNQIGVDAIDRMQADPEIQRGLKQLAKKFGLGTIDFYNAWSKNSQKSMWFVRDTMYVQAVRETMALNERRGTPINLKEAIRRVEEHMPNYRLPPEVLHSRMLSQMLQNPNIAIFSRYHYGVAKSLLNIGKDLVKPGDLRTPEARQNFKNGLDSMLAAGVAMTVGYALLDVLAEKVFGEGAKVRRAGPFHILEAARKAATGERDLSALAYTVFTFNPVLLTLIQLILNKNLFTGKQVYHPEDDMGQIASDVGTYAAKAVPQISTGLQAQDQGDMTGAIAKQFDVQYKTPKQQEMIERSRKYRERQKKSRDTKRMRGEYNP